MWKMRQFFLSWNSNLFSTATWNDERIWRKTKENLRHFDFSFSLLLNEKKIEVNKKKRKEGWKQGFIFRGGRAEKETRRRNRSSFHWSECFLFKVFFRLIEVKENWNMIRGFDVKWTADKLIQWLRKYWFYCRLRQSLTILKTLSILKFDIN